MKQFNFLAQLLILLSLVSIFVSCNCDISNAYNWTNQVGNTPPQAMLDELSNILNDDSCNPNINQVCVGSNANFKELILGNTPAEAGADNYGGAFGGSDGNEDFVILHEVINNTSTITNFTIAELNQIRDLAIDKANESAPYCSCQSYRAKVVNIEVKAWEQAHPPGLNNQWRRSLYITVTYHCCGQCA